MLNQFWMRWRTKYLLELREAHHRHGGNPVVVPPLVGDAVLVGEDGTPRGFWKLARVISLITGRDGHPRGAILHVPSSGSNGTLQRPLQHLYPLEVAATPILQECGREDPVPRTVAVETVLESPEMTGGGTEPQQERPRQAAAADTRDRLAAYAVLESES